MSIQDIVIRKKIIKQKQKEITELKIEIRELKRNNKMEELKRKGIIKRNNKMEELKRKGKTL